MITLPILDLLLAFVVAAPATAPAHPHFPKAITIAGAQGQATLAFRTIPWNPETAANARPGSISLGIAFNTEMDLTCGEIKIPAATYTIGVIKAEDGGYKQASLSRRGEDPILVPMKPFTADEEEHLTVNVLNKGYTTNRPRSTQPVDGTVFAVMLSLGNLHRQFELKEVFKTDG